VWVRVPGQAFINRLFARITSIPASIQLLDRLHSVLQVP
jgi:hypothetical protein